MTCSVVRSCIYHLWPCPVVICRMHNRRHECGQEWATGNMYSATVVSWVGLGYRKHIEGLSKSTNVSRFPIRTRLLILSGGIRNG